MVRGPGKFCVDLNHVRWSLLEGIITRTSTQGGAWATAELPVQQVTAVEKLTIEKSHRPRLGVPVTLLAVGLLAVSWWADSIFGGLIGLLCLYWGAKRVPKQKEVLEAHRIVGTGLNLQEWLVVGSGADIAGFVEGLQAELSEKAESVEASGGSAGGKARPAV